MRTLGLLFTLLFVLPHISIPAKASRLKWQGPQINNEVVPEPTSSISRQKTPVTHTQSAQVQKFTPNKGFPSQLELSLEDCIRMALNSNLDLLSRGQDPLSALQQLKEASAIFEPEIFAEFETRRTRIAPRTDERDLFETSETTVNTLRAGLAGFLPPGTRYSLSAENLNTLGPQTGFASRHNTVLSFNVTQPLLRGFGTAITTAQIRFNKHLLEAAEADYETFLGLLVESVHNRYHDVLFFRANLAAKSEDLILAEQLLADNQQRVEVGSMAPLDVTQARAAVFARRLDLIRAERQLINAENALKRLIFPDIAPVLESRLIPVRVPPPPTGLGSQPEFNKALGKRPEIRSARARIELNKVRLQLARNDLLPTLNLSANAQTRGRDDDIWTSFRDSTDGYETAWSAGLLVNVPLGFAAERARKNTAQLRLQQARLDLQALEQDIILDVETAFGNVITAQLAHAAAREARIFIQESAAAEEELLRNGASTTFRVSQLQRDLAQARTDELRALLDWYRALAALARAEGKILEAYNVRVIINPIESTGQNNPTQYPARKTPQSTDQTKTR